MPVDRSDTRLRYCTIAEIAHGSNRYVEYEDGRVIQLQNSSAGRAPPRLPANTMPSIAPQKHHGEIA